MNINKFLQTALVLTAASAFVACSSGPDRTADVQTAVTENASAPTATPAPVMLPFTLALSADSEGRAVTVSVSYLEDTAPAVLTIEPAAGTSIVDGAVTYRQSGASGKVRRASSSLVEDLPAASAGETLVRSFVLAGEQPAVDVRLGIYEVGFAFEMHESWPPQPAADDFDRMETLEHPVEINGVSIEKSVTVKPHRRTGD